MNKKVAFLTGWSNPGGSTTAFINLTNLLNANGIDATLYGPHTYHLDKCKSSTMDKLSLSPNTTYVFHFMKLPSSKLPCRTLLSCHETNLFDLNKQNLKYIDMIHFVSQSQKDWHKVNHPSIIIPNVLHNFQKFNKMTTNTAGIIGSVDRLKQVHLSIQRALDAGYSKIHIYGLVTDKDYYMSYIKPLIDKYSSIIKLCGYEDCREKIYSSVDEVFHSSLRETFNYIKQECLLTGTKYNGLDTAESNAIIMSNDEIVEKWKEII